MSNRSLTDIRAVITGALGLIGLYLVVCSVLFNSAEEMSKTGGINANLWSGLGLLAIAAWILLVFGPSDAAWVAFGYAIIWGLSAGPSAQAFYSVWSPELFATPYRSGAQGIVFFIVRMASGAISLIFPVILMKPNGLLIDGLILIGFLVAATLIGTIFAPRTQGKSLEQIEIERYGTKVTNTTATQ